MPDEQEGAAARPKNELVDISILTGPQTIIVHQMLDMAAKLKNGDDLGEVIAAYDERESGPRFSLPVFNHTIAGHVDEYDILQYRVWVKPPDEEVGCITATTLREAEAIFKELTEQGQHPKPYICGVVWDNATACFAECHVKDME